MLGKGQFSLSYLLLDVFWWALTLANLRALDAVPTNRYLLMGAMLILLCCGCRGNGRL